MKKTIITIAAIMTLLVSTVPVMFANAANAANAGPLDSVKISPATALVAVNGTHLFTAVSKDAANETVSNVTYNWSVVAGGGTINATSGLFTAGNATGTFNGTVQVTAVQGNITKTANASVKIAVSGQIVTLAVSPAVATVPINGKQKFTVAAKDAFHQNAPGVNLTWSVVAGGGTINATSGLFTAGNATGTFNGTVQVTAVQGNTTMTATATVMVATGGVLDHVAISPAKANVTVNGTQKFNAAAKDAFNNNVHNVTYTWSVISGGGSINATSGLFTAGNTTGNSTIRVTAVQGNVTVTANTKVTVTNKTPGKPGMPPGFDKGKKKGWGDHDTPPGWDKGKKNGRDAKDDDKPGEHGKANPPAPAKSPADHGNSKGGNNPAAGNKNSPADKGKG